MLDYLAGYEFLVVGAQLRLPRTYFGMVYEAPSIPYLTHLGHVKTDHVSSGGCQ